MKKTQGGFTLIELIVVIVLLGILGVTALARFQDITGDAERATVDAIATEVTGGSAINYAKSLVSTTFAFNIGDGPTGSGTASIDTATEAGACASADIDGLLASGAFPNVNGQAVTLDATGVGVNLCAAGAGSTYTCPVLLAGAALVPPVTVTITCTE
ncbi:MAG: type II secretion system protein [Gammaproteobacteria bacterium]|nr:type II secretion system protein [Gammaproteobacteria bacterium]